MKNIIQICYRFASNIYLLHQVRYTVNDYLALQATFLKKNEARYYQRMVKD